MIRADSKFLLYFAEIKDLFVSFDKDKNGSLTESEVRKGLFNLGRNPTEKEIKDILSELGIKKGMVKEQLYTF